MKKAIFYILCALLGAYIGYFLPEAEIIIPVHMPITDRQELCISWSIPGRTGPASYDDRLSITDYYFSIEFFEYPGDEALFLSYIGIRHYEYNAASGGRTWFRFISEFWPYYDSFGYSFDVVF